MIHEIREWLNDDNVPIAIRQACMLAILVALSQLMVIPVTVAVGVDFISRIVGSGLCFVIFCLLTAGVYIATRKNNITMLRILFEIITYLALPATFLTAGGVQCGAIIWFVIGAISVFNTSAKNTMPLRMFLYLAESTALIYYDILNPGKLPHLSGLSWALDTANSFIIVALCICLFIAWTNHAYAKRGRALEESLRRLEEEIRERERLQAEATTDKLTGVANRSAYAAVAEALDANGISDDTWYVGIDINGLKHVNDTYGHEAGDELIIAAAGIVQRAVGSYGNVYRLGGDEFVAIVNAGPEDFAAMLRQIRSGAENWRGRFSDRLSFSLGYVSAAEMDSDYVADMAKLADINMYREKQAFYEQNSDYDRRIMPPVRSFAG